MRTIAAAFVVALAVVVARPAARASAQNSPADQELDAALTAAYNLDYDEALARARHAVALDPNASRMHRGLASIIWLQLQFERGAVTVDHALGGIAVPPLAVPRPNTPAGAELKGALKRAIQLAEKRLKQKSDDVDAMFDAGAAYGLQASYMVSIENGFAGAFRYARRAFEMQNAVLVRDPSRAAAGLVVGNYRYLVGSQASVVRFFAFFAGFVGGKERAISLLDAASHDPLTRVDAKTALVNIYSREGQYTEALRIVRELVIELPNNRLFRLEEGAAAIRAGRDDEADAALTRGLAAFDADRRPKIPGEHALWLYRRGLARLHLRHLAEATEDLRGALADHPPGWVEGRVHVALGNVADLAGNRPDAIVEYTKAKQTCQASPDAKCRTEARQFLKQPFTR